MPTGSHSGAAPMSVESGAASDTVVVVAEVQEVKPLVEAACVGDVAKVSELLRQGAEANQMDAQGRTALVHSSNFGHTDVVKMLVQNGADVNLSDPTNRCSPIAAAAFSGHTEIVEQLLHTGADCNAQTMRGATPMLLASQEGNTGTVEVLLSSRGDPSMPDQAGKTPLIKACERGHLDVVKLLLRGNADVNQPTIRGGFTPVWCASFHGHVDLLPVLVEANADVNATAEGGDSPLMACAANGHSAMVEQLVAAKASVDQQTGCNDTPLYNECQRRWHEAVLIQCLLGEIAPPENPENLPPPRLTMASLRPETAPDEIPAAKRAKSESAGESTGLGGVCGGAVEVLTCGMVSAPETDMTMHVDSPHPSGDEVNCSPGLRHGSDVRGSAEEAGVLPLPHSSDLKRNSDEMLSMLHDSADSI